MTGAAGNLGKFPKNAEEKGEIKAEGVEKADKQWS